MLGYAVTFAVTLVFVYLALRGVRLADAWRGLRNSEYGWMVPALGAFALSLGLRALRWRALFQANRRPPLGAVTNAMLVGYLFNNILPARAGEAARVVTLRQRARTPSVEVVGTVMVERAYDVLALLILLLAASPWLPHVTWLTAASTVALVLAVVLTATIVVLAVYGDRPLRWVLRPLGRLPVLSRERVELAATELVEGLSGLRDVRVALEAFMWTMAAWLMSALSAWLVTLAFHLHVPLAAGVLVVVAAGLGMALPSPPAAVGVFEAAALLALQAYSISHTRALPYALVLHLLNFVPFVLAGVAVLQFNARRPPRRTRATVHYRAQLDRATSRAAG